MKLFDFSIEFYQNRMLCHRIFIVETLLQLLYMGNSQCLELEINKRLQVGGNELIDDKHNQSRHQNHQSEKSGDEAKEDKKEIEEEVEALEELQQETELDIDSSA